MIQKQLFVTDGINVKKASLLTKQKHFQILMDKTMDYKLKYIPNDA